MYWGVAAMDLMGRLNNMDRGKIIEFLVACQDPQSGGGGAVRGHDPHILNTLSAVQVAVTLDCLDQLDTEGVVRYVVARQQEDGSFTGDRWGERDNRFGFCALATLALLGRLDAVDTELAAEFVCSCMNFDGGFGSGSREPRRADLHLPGQPCPHRPVAAGGRGQTRLVARRASASFRRT